MSERVIESQSPEKTRELGELIGAAVAAESSNALIVIALSGELGAGKTTLTAGFLRALGVTVAVRSPTYTLVEPYEQLGGRNVYHLDLYRLSGSAELEMLGLRDLLVPGSVFLIEWPERGGTAVPAPDLTVSIRYPLPSEPIHPDYRSIVLQAHSVTGELLVGKSLAVSC